MQILSQNDPRWKNIKLGTSDVTIGNYGCTITSIAMILNTTPDIVNKKLLGVSGYSQGNLVIWAKIEVAFPGIKVRRVWSYNNEDVKNNLPCLVEVDGKPIGGYRHWVVYIGNQKCYDPWDGQEDSTSDYPNPLSCCVISGKLTNNNINDIQNIQNISMSPQTKIPGKLLSSQDHPVNEKFVEIQALNGFLAEFGRLKESHIGALRNLETKEKELATAKGTIRIRDETINDLAIKLEKLQSSLDMPPEPAEAPENTGNETQQSNFLAILINQFVRILKRLFNLE